MNSIQETPNVSKEIIYEDVFIGSFLNSKGIFPIHLNLYSNNIQDLYDGKALAWHNSEHIKVMLKI